MQLRCAKHHCNTHRRPEGVIAGRHPTHSTHLFRPRIALPSLKGYAKHDVYVWDRQH